MRVLTGFLAAVPFCSMAAAQTIAPSFDCSKAESSAEDAICQTDKLAELDNELSRIYGLAWNGPNSSDRVDDLKAMQRGWIKGRDECWKSDFGVEDCVTFAYGSRIHEIRTLYFDARSDDENGISAGPFPYVCDGLDAIVSASFVNGSDPIVSLRWRENELVLTRTETASGARYQGETWDGDAEFWTKGDEATLTLPNGKEFRCVQDEIG